MKKLLSVFVASLLVLTGLSFSSINQGNTASAKTKYKTTITYKGQKYVYVGHYKHHFSKKEVKKVVKFSKGIHSGNKLVSAASKLSKNGYVKASSAIYKAFDFGLKNELKSNYFYTAAKKGTGVTISYDMYAAKTGPNHTIAKNFKHSYN